MELDINEILEQAKQSVSDKEYQIWILKVQVEQLSKENEALRMRLENEQSARADR